jgi:flagellar basal body-associated protein FliL
MKLNSNKQNNNDNPFMEVNDNDFLSNDNSQFVNSDNSHFVNSDNSQFVDNNSQFINNEFENSQFSQDLNNNTPMNQQISKKKKSPLIFIIIGVVVVLLIAVICVLIGGKGEEKPVVDTPVEVSNPEKEENKDKQGEEENEEPVEEPIDESKEHEEEPNMAESNILAFEDDMIGIKFNFNSDLYIQKNTQEIFNTLKSVIPEDRTNFNIFTDKLNNTLNVCKLTTGKADGIYINVSVIPFELEKATTTLKIDGTTVIENETIGSVDFNNEELIKNYDTQIKETVQQMGCTIVEYGDSTVREIGSIEKENKKLQGIFTSRIYTGPVDVTTSTGTVDVAQCTIPIGKNAILITAVTDGRPVEIDKTVLLNEIAESFIVTAEIPKEESEKETEKTE